MRKITIYHDPGHSWAKVPVALIDKLGLTYRITPYSYQRNDYVYLEEDCDLATFLHAWHEQIGPTPQFIEKSTNRSSKIRSYAPYHPTHRLRRSV